MPYKALRIGLMKADRINQTLGTELVEAEVWLSKAAHRHIALDHPDDYKSVVQNLGLIINDPAYVGQRPGRTDNFYLVRRVRDEGRAILVAIGIQQNRYGTYNVRSAYTISEADIQRYRQAGHLHIL